jgi:hypothetical protein
VYLGIRLKDTENVEQGYYDSTILMGRKHVNNSTAIEESNTL